jgi:hypothetical protein
MNIRMNAYAYFEYTVLKTKAMKKIKKQPSVRSETPETPVSQVRYILLYERHSSYHTATGKKFKTTPGMVSKVRNTSFADHESLLAVNPFRGMCQCSLPDIENP